MKCPVCDKKLENTVQKCSKCGFEDLRTEFINENELEMWQTYVVYPCRFAYQTTVTQTKKLQQKFQKELKEIKKAQEDIQNFSENNNRSSINNEKPSFKKLVFNKNDGWVTKGNITYKNFYECTRGNDLTKCEISNIFIDIIGNNITVNFLVKKVFDYEGAKSTGTTSFSWKLKDDYGIVVADGDWRNYHLCEGDIITGTFSISGLDSSIKYVLEFVNA